MIYICNFYAHKKEAISNQIEMLRSYTNGSLFSAGIFLDQKHLLAEDVRNKRIILSELDFLEQLPKFVASLPKEESIHYFSEEPEEDKLNIFNSVSNNLYISLYRRPTKEYADFLKKLFNLKNLYVEIEEHRKILIDYGIEKTKIIVSHPPSILERNFTTNEFKGRFLFGSWNGGDHNSLIKRGLVAILDLLNRNTNTTCNILLRDNETVLYRQMIKDRNLQNRVTLSTVLSHSDLIKNFNETDVVLFLMQKQLTKDIPNSIVDGFALGKPVLMTDIVDLAEIVKNKKLGWVIKPGEPFDTQIISETYNERSNNVFLYSENLTSQQYVQTIVNAYQS